MPTLDINDTTLFYDELGSGEPIILHHGYTGSHDVWLDAIAPPCDVGVALAHV